MEAIEVSISNLVPGVMGEVHEIALRSLRHLHKWESRMRS
jgi:hypothetical protein